MAKNKKIDVQGTSVSLFCDGRGGNGGRRG